MIDRSRIVEQLRGLAAGLEAEPHSACVLGRDGEIVFVNSAWNRFAVENGGVPGCLGERVIGKTYFNFIDGAAPRAFFEGAWLRVLAGRPVTLRSECSTPTLIRELTSLFLPVRVGGDFGAAVIHSVDRVVAVAVRRDAPNDLGPWLGAGGRIDACTGCRRARRLDGSRWDLVPAFIESPPPARWSFCPVCAAQLRSEREGASA